MYGQNAQYFISDKKNHNMSTELFGRESFQRDTSRAVFLPELQAIMDLA